MYAYIGRQPIYNKTKEIVGYELLYRDGTGGNTAHISDGDAATRGVLSDAITVFGLPHLTNRLPAYINFTRNLLLGDFAYLANPEDVVIQVLGSMPVDDALAGKISELRQAGFRLALNDYSREGAKFEKILPFFDVIRVDIRGENNTRLRETVSRLAHGRTQMLAERVETEEEFNLARNAGFSLFQGYFFEKPTCLSRQIPSLSASTYGMLMNELLKPSVNFAACCEMIQRDAVLTYLLMRQVQTAQYYRGNTIDDIMHCLVMMGTEALRRWVCLVLLKQNNISHSDELAKKAFLRGLFIERLIENANTRMDHAQGFLLGLFSLLDQVMGIRLENLLADLRLDPHLKAALLGREENEASLFLQYAVIYEMGNERLILPDIHLRLNPQEVSGIYMSCLADTDAAFSRMEGR